MHGHSARGALIAGIAAFAAAVAILVFVPSHRTVSAATAAFFLLFALKHVALLATIGLPATAGVRRFWRRHPTRADDAPRPLRANADGYWRTGEVEPHRGILRLEHDVRALPATASRQALLELDADKRMTLRFLDDIDGDALRAGLVERYAKYGYRDSATVERFLAPLAGPIARGESIAIGYDAGAQTTRLALGEMTAEIAGREFMHATWRLWFDDAVPARLADALVQNLPRTI